MSDFEKNMGVDPHMKYQYMWQLEWRDAIDKEEEAMYMAKWNAKAHKGNQARFRLLMSPQDIRSFRLIGKKWYMYD